MRTQFETTTTRAIEIFAAGKVYEVPPYQRNYAWGEEEWTLLWEDLLPLWEGTNAFHYMGPLLFQEDEKRTDHFFIIDGQQRLATLTLLALAAIHQFERWAKEAEASGHEDVARASRERAEIFRRRFIGEKEPTALYYRTRLKLNRIDEPFFHQMLNDNYKEGPPHSPLPSSHKQIHRCYEFFSRKIESEIGDPQTLAVFLDKVISQKLFFTRIVVADEANAYLIFETLNARGIELAPNDLIKNYLFSLLEKEEVPQSDIEHLLGNWDDIMRELGPREFVRFLRGYLNSHVSPVVRRERLFWHVKRKVQDRDAAKRLIEDLKQKATLYLALRNPNDQFWNEWPNHQVIRFYLTLLNWFNVRQHHPLIFAMYDAIMRKKFARAEFVRLLKHITIIVFRYNIIGQRNPNQIEAVYNEIAVGIRKGAIKTWQGVWHYLSDLYVRDNEFIQAFANAEFKGKRYIRLIKYILLTLEFYVKQPGDFRFDDPQIVALVNDPRVTIEHVLPQTTDNVSWGGDFEPHLQKVFRWRLGNLTLLEDTLNRSIGSKSFEEKRKVYSKSKYVLTREIAEIDRWMPDSVLKRQEKLAKRAAKIWRSNFDTTLNA